MAGQTRTWTVGDTWNKVAYTYYGDSREFRYILSLNESYSIATVPAQGSAIFITGPDGSLGKNPPNALPGAAGTLNQLSTALNLSGSNPNPQDNSLQTAIFPWDTLDGYVGRLSQYTAFALFERDRVNGYGLDSLQAVGDTQRG
jgi:hypothetical protein